MYNHARESAEDLPPICGARISNPRDECTARERTSNGHISADDHITTCRAFPYQSRPCASLSHDHRHSRNRITSAGHAFDNTTQRPPSEPNCLSGSAFSTQSSARLSRRLRRRSAKRHIRSTSRSWRTRAARRCSRIPTMRDVSGRLRQWWIPASTSNTCRRRDGTVCSG